MNDREKFEKWAFDNNVTNLYPISFGAAWAAWQAALSTRKSYGHGVIEGEGHIYISGTTEIECQNIAKAYNELHPERNFRVVELFYEDSDE